MSTNLPGTEHYKLVDPFSVHFSIFTTQEIRELSVIKISTPLTFDALGHPLKGGLYDPVLGPLNERGDPCGTCFRTISTCPGHFGHIELPMPVVNPLFHKFLYTILSNSCLNCHKFQLSHKVKGLLTLKLQLINAGLVTDAMDVDCLVSDLTKSNPSDFSEENVVKKYLKVLKSKNAHLEPFSNKNAYRIHDKFVSEAIKNIKIKACLYCEQNIAKITKLNNKLIYSIFVTEDNKMIKKNTTLMPDSSKSHLRKLWENDKELLQQVVPVLKTIKTEYPVDIFFLDIIPVPPPLVRPCNILRNQLIEHPQTQVYKAIIKTNFVIRAIIQVMQLEMGKITEDVNFISDEAKAVVETAMGSNTIEKLHNACTELQANINNLMNSENATGGEQGLKQIIEKKEGVIRLHMMGKRVNFAARSVITPDPNLNIDEIGIPEAFAIKLTYPIPVTTWNVEELRKMVINGPNKHPGATTIENEDGKVVSIPAWSLSKRESLAMRLLTPDESKVKGVKTVHRHLINGDVMLLNRQPTLHKPSIMAHKARVLKGEKTLRLHYANCKAYNADFDGDEMNAHFPQNEIARSEAYNIMNVNNQYLVPKDGTPLSGLIQDHVISGVCLSIRGKFFTKSDYQQLVFQGLSHLRSKIQLLPPTILKPQRLWSGKQVLSTLIINITPKNMKPITLASMAKISPRAWQTASRHTWRAGGTLFATDNTMSESEVVIQNGELLSGVLDKSHFGATQFGLVHSFYELYGGNYSSILLSSLAKLFTFHLQWEGFTLGVRDILVVPKADKTRSKIIQECRCIGHATAADAVGLDSETDRDDLISALELSISKDNKFKALLDRKYKTSLDNFTNDINKAILPLGLLEQFPSNNLQLMVQSGAKGSTVNTMQISCLLGQIELEGKRPPVMVSGRSLPSFPPFETSPRAGGFIDGRFMTGIQPQEFFFHCMAGREGLIDTAVKTSKSGYLQRCLIKHLEGLTVKYDMTVRDSDESIIQFAYGEDGMDVCKAQYFNDKHLKFLDLNTKSILNKNDLSLLKEASIEKKINKHNKSLKKWSKKYEKCSKRSGPFNQFANSLKDEVDTEHTEKYYDGREVSTCNLIEAWQSADSETKESYLKKYGKRHPDPLTSIMSADHNFGVINEKLSNLMDQYLKKRSDLINFDAVSMSTDSDFKDMMLMKAIKSLVVPGEPVGLLAAQSVGEPSTQMTLNTFHFAGRGEMNVTLGIPRLREILMMASSNLKTPNMDIPFLPSISDFTRKAEKLQRKFSRITVENVLHKINVQSELKIHPTKVMSYVLEFHFLPRRMYKHLYNLTPKQILHYMEKVFFGHMFNRIWKVAGRKSGAMVGAKSEEKKMKNDEDDDEKLNQNPKKGIFNEEMESSDEEQGNEDDDNTQAKTRKRRTECQEYDDPESEEEEQSDQENEPQEKNDEDEGFEDEDIKPDIKSLEIVGKFNEATNYTYDNEKYLWCKLAFDLPLSTTKIDLTAVLKYLAERCVIKEVTNIKRAILYPNNKGEFVLKTDGINITEMFKYDDLLDLNKLYSNDIHAIAKTYGIEAACKVIIKEVQNVFGVYGIKVDFRHLSLISDYMTYNGIFEPLSRKGMEASTSPLQQMSFESSLTFLKEAVVKGKQDALGSASSCLMVGQPCKSGTGSFSLYNSYKFSNK